MAIRDRSERVRGTYIGGHDAARIVGEFPYGAGAADTYAAVVHRRVIEQTPRMLRGLLFEPGFAAWVEDLRGVPQKRDVFVIDDDVPFFAGSVDAIEDGGRVIHEFTTTTTDSRHMWGVPNTDDCARHKWIQSQWYIGMLPGFEEAHVWCFVVDGDEDPLHYVVARNELAIAELRSRAEAFWYDHVLARVPPLPGVHDVFGDDNEALNACFPSATAPELADVDAEFVLQAQKYASFRAAQKMAEVEKKSAAAKLKAMLGGHEGGRWDGGSVSWKSHSIGAKTNWEAVAYELAKIGRVNGEVWSGLVREQTFEAKSIRSIKVNVRGIK